ncbi:MAG: Rieske (2Fe-2S) protein [Actinomycetota bacterium]
MSQSPQLPTTGRPAPDGALRAQEMNRRTVIRTAGVVGAGVVGIASVAACGAGSGAADGTAGGSGSDTAVIKVADIPVGGGKVFKDTKIVVTQPTAGEFKAFSAICTHKGCTVSGVASQTITCPCHGSTYDATSGAVTGGPAPAPLPAKTVKISGGSLTIS